MLDRLAVAAIPVEMAGIAVLVSDSGEDGTQVARMDCSSTFCESGQHCKIAAAASPIGIDGFAFSADLSLIYATSNCSFRSAKLDASVATFS